MVVVCQDLPLWPCPSIIGDSPRMSHPISPPPAPSLAPQAPLGSRGTTGRKEALCLGRGKPRKASNGPPPAPGMWRDCETPRTRVPRAVQSCLGSPCFCPASVPAGAATCPSKVPSSQNPMSFSSPSQSRGSKWKPSQVSWPRALLPVVLASFGQILGSGGVESSLPQLLSQELKSQLPAHIGEPGQETSLRASASPSVRC